MSRMVPMSPTARPRGVLKKVLKRTNTNAHKTNTKQLTDQEVDHQEGHQNQKEDSDEPLRRGKSGAVEEGVVECEVAKEHPDRGVQREGERGRHEQEEGEGEGQ